MAEYEQLDVLIWAGLCARHAYASHTCISKPDPGVSDVPAVRLRSYPLSPRYREPASPNAPSIRSPNTSIRSSALGRLCL
jgi:hypothetical protein